MAKRGHQISPKTFLIKTIPNQKRQSSISTYYIYHHLTSSVIPHTRFGHHYHNWWLSWLLPLSLLFRLFCFIEKVAPFATYFFTPTCFLYHSYANSYRYDINSRLKKKKKKSNACFTFIRCIHIHIYIKWWVGVVMILMHLQA